MLKVNEYFDGKVKSIGFTAQGLPATVGVMLAGEYEFSTSQLERMTLVAGRWEIRLPGETGFQTYKCGQTFTVAAGQRFGLKVLEDAAYYCQYE